MGAKFQITYKDSGSNFWPCVESWPKVAIEARPYTASEVTISWHNAFICFWVAWIKWSRLLVDGIDCWQVKSSLYVYFAIATSHSTTCTRNTSVVSTVPTSDSAATIVDEDFGKKWHFNSTFVYRAKENATSGNCRCWERKYSSSGH